MPWIYRLHKWASLLVGLQLLIWLLTGLYFNVVNHDIAGGSVYRSYADEIVGTLPDSRTNIATLLKRYPLTSHVELTVIDQQPFYLLYQGRLPHGYQLQQIVRVDAQTGRDAGEITKQQAVLAAKASYSGPGDVVSAQRLAPPYRDMVREENPVWQVQFEDEYRTRVYLHAITGRVIRHTNEPYQFRDLMYMLHFMDYFDTGGFNTVLLKIFSVLALLLSLSGLVWLIALVAEGQFRLPLVGKKHPWRFVDGDDNGRQLVTAPQQSILGALLHKQVPIPSECGGGGQCGRCQVIIWPLPEALAQERRLLTPEQLSQGRRLACQHVCGQASEVRLSSTTEGAYQLTLVDKKYLSPFVISLRFQPDKAITYRAGAHMQFQIPEGKAIFVPSALPEEYQQAWQRYHKGSARQPACQRNYSVANAPDKDSSLTFLVRLHPAKQDDTGYPVSLPGKGSMFMSALGPGDVVSATGPFETFRLQSQAPRHRVFIGAGSGMAPLRAMIEQLLFVDVVSTPVTLFQGAKTHDTLFYRAEFMRWQGWFEHFSYQSVCSEEASEHLPPGHVQTLVQQLMTRLKEQDNSALETEFYLCGPPKMMDEVRNILLLCNISAAAIFTDEFSY